MDSSRKRSPRRPAAILSTAAPLLQSNKVDPLDLVKRLIASIKTQLSADEAQALDYGLAEAFRLDEAALAHDDVEEPAPAAESALPEAPAAVPEQRVPFAGIDPDALYDDWSAAHALGISVPMLRSLRRAGRLPYHQLSPRTRRYRGHDLIELFKSSEVKN